MGTRDWEVGVVELFYPDLAAARAFYAEGHGLPVDREDETSVSFVIGELVLILLNAPAAAELVEPVPVALRPDRKPDFYVAQAAPRNCAAGRGARPAS